MYDENKNDKSYNIFCDTEFEWAWLHERESEREWETDGRR